MVRSGGQSNSTGPAKTIEFGPGQFWRLTANKSLFALGKTVARNGWGLALAAVFVVVPSEVYADQRPVVSLLEFRQDRVVMQQWDLSCGAAALATLLNYQHGDSVSERDIAVALMKRNEYVANPSLVNQREGFSLLDLTNYVNKRGYRAQAYGKLDLDILVEMSPILVPISASGYSHFVVFRGMEGNRVLLADPAWGNRTMTVDQFRRVWLEFPKFGRVGFQVLSEGDATAVNRLAPMREHFLSLK